MIKKILFLGFIVAAITLNANAQCNANFTFSLVGDTVIFNNTSTVAAGGTKKYAWDFGDATTSTVKNPKHGYAVMCQNYTVQLILIDTVHICADTLKDTIYAAHQGLAASFTKFRTNNDIETFTNTSTWSPSFTSVWHFSNANGLNLYAYQDTTINFGNPFNANTAVLTITTPDGCTASSTQLFNTGMSAHFTYNPVAGDTIKFTNGTQSTGSFISFWTFGDGGTSTATSPKHFFPHECRKYYVCLNAVDTVNLKSSTWCDSVMVTPFPASFGANFTFSVDDSIVTFTNTSLSIPNFTSHWTFKSSTGLNVTSVTKNNTIDFKPGIKSDTATLTITTADGCTSSITKTFKTGCKSYFTYDVTTPSGTAYHTLSLKPHTNTPILTYLWTINGGGLFSSTVDSPTVNLSAGAIYNVCLKTTHANSCVSVYCNELNTFNTGITAITDNFAYLNAYPTPADDMLHINFELKINAAYTIAVTDIAGKIIYESTSNNASGKVTVQLPTADYANGVYLLKVTSGDKAHYQKVVIQH